jgi:hypothetical protein
MDFIMLNFCRIPYTLRENAPLPCVKMFAVRFLSGARQSLSLPRVFLKAHGKHLHTASVMFAARL